MHEGSLRCAWLLRCEGAAVFAVCVAIYLRIHAPPLPYAALILLPDVTIAAYLFGRETGAVAYNLAHTYAFPLVIAGAGMWTQWNWPLPVALVWVMHIGIDRLLGYGMKYPGARFDDTHLQRV